jgi:hypothetical protein
VATFIFLVASRASGGESRVILPKIHPALVVERDAR